MKVGLLIINLGTPAGNNKKAVATYLREFLTDKRVVTLPWLFRQLLVNGLIIPFRVKNSTHAYQAIWTNEGSPLLHHSQQLAKKLQLKLGSSYEVQLGMRYGQPAIATALNQLRHCDFIHILPLYPQYSSAATGSSIEVVMNYLSQLQVIPSINLIRDFYRHPAYLQAQAQLIKQYWQPEHHLLFSYHGLPERQLIQSGCTKKCSSLCPEDFFPGCYKGQCSQTSRLLAQELNLKSEQYSSAFQSRLGRTEWIKPYTDQHLKELVAKGITQLTVVCPSFVADCLETLEEIDIRLQEDWLRLGGTDFTRVPSLNDDDLWVDAITQIIA